MMSLLRDLYLYRHFVLSSIRNDLVTRFAASKLGAVWTILNPLSLVLIYSLVLSNILEARLPGTDSQHAYAIYLMAGLLAWNLFSEIINRCLTLFIEQSNLLKKVSFPRITLPTIVIGSCIVNNMILFIAIIVIATLLGHDLGWPVLWVIPMMFVVSIFALGFGIILGLMNVFVRDIGQLIPIVLQITFWFTPIVYPANILSEELQSLLIYNPMYYVVSAYQGVFIYNQTHVFGTGLILMLSVGMLLAVVSLFLFRRASPELVDVL